jgi:hypothetical protein
MRSSRTSIRTIACVAGLGLMVVQAALAAEKQPIRFNAADQAAAKAVTVKAADLGPAWKGGATKPDLTPEKDCSFKNSDLVLTGAAKSVFKMEAAGASITSESNVLQTPAMVTAEWRRSFGSSRYMACARKVVMNPDAAKVTFVSFKKIAFPKLARYSARYRMVADYGDAGNSVRVLVDIVVLGQGRTEISLIVTMAYADRAQADLFERALAKVLVRRVDA